MNSLSNNILLSNLIIIRWIAITGQFFSIVFVFFYLNISIPFFECLLIILISCIINIFSFFSNKKIKNYLSDRGAFYFLSFDTLQLGILLYLTGGIYNPFSLLLIAPLIISASYLPIFYSIILLLLSILSVNLISIFFIPINWNESFNFPILFSYGLTLSLIISLVFIAVYVYLFASSSRGISEALSNTKLALANQKKISEIDTLSAAAVHELSTPLNTIFLILNDLQEEEDIKENKEINKEINLLKSQADRCKKILLTLSKNPENLKDNFFNNTTITNLIKLNFDKFNNRKILLEINSQSKDEEPKITYKDEIIYGLGNIIQNAIEHSNKKIVVNISWDRNKWFVSIIDDGKGFKPEILDKIGKPYISKKEKGMGLGIFIAKNLIENIGGTILFINTKDSGACVEISLKHVS